MKKLLLTLMWLISINVFSVPETYYLTVSSVRVDLYKNVYGSGLIQTENCGMYAKNDKAILVVDGDVAPQLGPIFAGAIGFNRTGIICKVIAVCKANQKYSYCI